MTRAEKICSWIYAGLVLFCVVFFRPLDRLILVNTTSFDGLAQFATVFFSLLCALMLIFTGKKEHIGESIAMWVLNNLIIGGIFYGEAWLLEHILK